LIAKPVARRDKPRSQQVSHEDALLALENSASVQRRRRAPPAILLVEHAPSHDGDAALPDTPSSPCQRSKTLPRARKPTRQTRVLTRPSCALLVPSSAPGRSRGCKCNRCRGSRPCAKRMARWWR